MSPHQKPYILISHWVRSDYHWKCGPWNNEWVRFPWRLVNKLVTTKEHGNRNIVWLAMTCFSFVMSHNRQHHRGSEHEDCRHDIILPTKYTWAVRTWKGHDTFTPTGRMHYGEWRWFCDGWSRRRGMGRHWHRNSLGPMTWVHNTWSDRRRSRGTVLHAHFYLLDHRYLDDYCHTHHWSKFDKPKLKDDVKNKKNKYACAAECTHDWTCWGWTHVYWYDTCSFHGYEGWHHGHTHTLGRVGAPSWHHAGYPSYGCSAVFYNWAHHCPCSIYFRLPHSFGVHEHGRTDVTISTRGQQHKTRIVSPCSNWYNSHIKGAECDAHMHRGQAFQIHLFDWGHQEGKVKVHLNGNRVAPEGAEQSLITLSPQEEIEYQSGQASKQSGLTAEYFAFWQGSYLPNLGSRTPEKRRIDKRVYFPSTGGHWSGLDWRFNDHFTVRWTGVYKANSGWHAFEIESDDGSKWYWNNANDIDNDGLHGMVKRSGLWRSVGVNSEIPVKLLFFEHGGGAGMILRYRDYWVHGWTFHVVEESKFMSQR